MNNFVMFGAKYSLCIHPGHIMPGGKGAGLVPQISENSKNAILTTINTAIAAIASYVVQACVEGKSTYMAKLPYFLQQLELKWKCSGENKAVMYIEVYRYRYIGAADQAAQKFSKSKKAKVVERF